MNPQLFTRSQKMKWPTVTLIAIIIILLGFIGIQTFILFSAKNHQTKQSLELNKNIPAITPEATSIQQSSLLPATKKLGEIPPNPTDSLDAIGPFFSPDYQHFVYTLRKGGFGGKWLIDLDGKEGKEIDWSTNGFIFSPDSKHFAYIAKKDNKELVVLDDKEGQEYDAITNFQFNSDGQHFVYVARREENKRIVVLDGKEGKKYDEITGLQFSSDGQHLIYMAMTIVNPAREENKQFIVLNNNGEEKEYEYKQYDEVSNLIFSPDGQHFAYIARERLISPPGIASLDLYFVVSDANEGKRYPTPISNLIFSPDSKHFAYVAYPASHGASNYAVVLDSKELEGYNAIYNLKFTPDSKLTYNAVKKTLTSEEVWYIAE